MALRVDNVNLMSKKKKKQALRVLVTKNSKFYNLKKMLSTLTTVSYVLYSQYKSQNAHYTIS